MNLSVIYLSTDKKLDKKTVTCLKKELKSVEKSEVLVYCRKNEDSLFDSLKDISSVEIIDNLTLLDEDKNLVDKEKVYSDAISRISYEVVTEVSSGDTFSEGTFKKIALEADSRENQDIFMCSKIMPDGKVGAFSDDPSTKDVIVMKLKEKFYCYPFYFGGTFIRSGLLKAYTFMPDFHKIAEKKFFLDICIKKSNVVFIRSAKYNSYIFREGDMTFYEGLYDPEYYSKCFSDFINPYLDEIKNANSSIPMFVQYHIMFMIATRFMANKDNKNKHVIEDEAAKEFLNIVGETLNKLDDKVIFNAHKVSECIVPDSMKWIFGILKYGEEFTYDEKYLSGKPYYGTGDVLFNTISNLKTNILFMNYQNGILEIDGTIHALLYSITKDVFFTYGGTTYKPSFNGRYSITKVFGVSIYKNHSFHVSIPIIKGKTAILFCFAKVNGESIKINLSYESHFSRMSGRFTNSYWLFGDDKEYIMTKAEDGLKIARATKSDAKEQERRLSKEMRGVGDKKALLFWGVRKVVFAVRPIMKRRPIWMYLDKIYKGGDSSEYLYKYASAQKSNIKHYYLIDKNTTDYTRLKKEGYKPLVRGSIKHRLVFLLADMMVISNSTVYAFNNFGMINSSYIRDIPDFHVCCVQHGMSVQKIAVAQNRLRDNTRLYFCASKYEIENLSRPIYDYVGYDALKLTGVPRYDGLVDDDKKQIMISPTWRMQAAAPVRTSEGEQRDYNPLFKESTYFKVFNSLINDERLISAAKKYGYRIKYVLHPIVSSQVDDFDKNDYVDIVPSVGDMSYEKMFCESSLMVTDFSGIQFDFAYMRKPLVYLHHKDIPQHYEEGSFFYETMGFGEITHDNDELINLLVEYMQNGCKMKDEYAKRADDFFYYDDHNNCERIYKEMVRYQNEFILHKNDIDEGVISKSTKVYNLVDGVDYQFDATEREETVELLKKLSEENDEPIKGKSFSDYYFDTNLRKKSVLLIGLGKNVRGNMQYILNALNTMDEFDGFTVFVRTSPVTDEKVQEFIKQNNWSRTQTVPDSKKYDRLMECCKYLLTEVYFAQGWVKRPGQVYINIWHGTPLKKLGLEKNSQNIHKDGNSQRNFIEADYLLYPNDYTRDNMLRSFRVTDLMRGKAVMLGYPRTGGILEALNSDLEPLRKRLAPNGEKIYAFMPTWRDYLSEERVVSETKDLLDYLDEGLRDDQILYVNLHHKVSDSLNYSNYIHIKQFPADVDSYKLLATTEALISDYSSVFYDYLVSRKQIILYCPDYDLYEKKRGTYMNLMDLPFDKAKTKKKVLDFINSGKTYDDTEAFNTFCAYDSEDNGKNLVKLFKKNEENVTVLPIPKSAKKQILIFSEDMADTRVTNVLKKAYEQCDTTNVNLYLGCDMDKVDKNKESAYPFMFDTNVIGVLNNVHFGSMTKTIRRMIDSDKLDLSFEEAMRFYKYDYYLHAKRAFGTVRFDKVLIYDVLDIDILLMLSFVDGDKYLFINEKNITQVSDSDTKMIEALRYVAGYARGVFADSELTKVMVENKLKLDKEVQVISDAYELNALILQEE